MLDESARTKIRVALDNLDSLPAMPAIAQKLLALPLNTESGEKQLLVLIEQDPQISAKLVSLANSPIMGVSRKIVSVKDASMLLGLTRVKSVALGIASMSSLVKMKPTENFKPEDLWIHSMMVAIVMRNLAQEMPRASRPPEDQIFLTGLLHDIGFMALHYIDAAASNALHLILKRQPERPIAEVELEVLGTTHCAIGTQLARHWNLPEEIVFAIGNHHPPHKDPAAAQNPMVLLIGIVEKLQSNFGITEHTGGTVLDQEWRGLGIDPDSAEDIANLADELAIQIAQQR
ncbi:MAG: HDOD domain-containing protein [Gallionella sp.]